jgi:hypothetical protein
MDNTDDDTKAASFVKSYMLHALTAQECICDGVIIVADSSNKRALRSPFSLFCVPCLLIVTTHDVQCDAM